MKLGFVSSQGGKSVEPLMAAAAHKGIEAAVLPLEDLLMEREGDEWKLYLGGEDVEKIGVVLVRGIGYCLKELEVLLEFVKVKNIRLIDPGLNEVKIGSGTKSLTAYRLGNEGVAYPPTIFVRGNLAENPFGYPCIVKPVMGRAGQGVIKIENREELINKLNTDKDELLMIQKWIPNDGDYRVLVLGEQSLGAMRRWTEMPGEYRNNVSLGAKAEAAKIEPAHVEMAIKAAAVCGWEFAGVDLIKHKDTGEWYVLEVNRSPQFEGFTRATGIDVAGVVVEYMINQIKTQNSKVKAKT
jgi:RimK family alpha-L-glutamate ligase